MTVDIPVSPVLATALGKEFIKARVDADLTQSRVADLADVTTGYVSQLESGRLPAYQTFRAMCKAVQVTPETLGSRIAHSTVAATLRKKAAVFEDLCRNLEEVL